MEAVRLVERMDKDTNSSLYDAIDSEAFEWRSLLERSSTTLLDEEDDDG